MAKPDTIYATVEVGAAKVVAEAPVSDGTTALEILNFRKTQAGTLESRFRVLPFINPGLVSGSDGVVPDAFENGCYGAGYMEWGGSVPELLFICTDGVYRYAPWFRTLTPHANPMLSEQFKYNEDGTTSSVVPQGDNYFPPQLEVIGNRIYFTYCDGGGAWVWDRERLRPFGFTSRPSGPSAMGPADAGDEDPNGGGFSAEGRIGTIESDWTREDGGVTHTVGGLDEGQYDYYLVLEGPDGAYSATSPTGGRATLRKEVAQVPSSDTATANPLSLRKRFRVQSIDPGPEGTAARILLRTANLSRLPPGDDGRPRFLQRLLGGNVQEYIDDIPDAELGAPWIDREQTPAGFYLLKSFCGSLFIARTEGAPSRIWWSEQGGANGPTPESILKGHWRDVFPNTGAISALHPAYLNNGANPATLLVFKETACHFINGQYPEWQVGTLHDYAGCAGPGAIQSLPDGSVVWFGNGTFWRMDRDGAVVDIGGPIKRRLSKVNHSCARRCVSWLSLDTQEAFFALPYGESTVGNYLFVFDWALGGFRFIDQMEEVLAAVRVTNSDMTLISGTYNGIQNMWMWDRAAYFDVEDDDARSSYLGVNPAVYQSGWCMLDDTGLHHAYSITSIVAFGRQAFDANASIECYRDYDRRESLITAQNVSMASPQDDTVVFWTDSDADFAATRPAVDDSLWSEETPYYCRVTVDATDTDVFSVKLTVPEGKVMDLVSLKAYAKREAAAGSRVARLPEV